MLQTSRDAEGAVPGSIPQIFIYSVLRLAREEVYSGSLAACRAGQLPTARSSTPGMWSKGSNSALIFVFLEVELPSVLSPSIGWLVDWLIDWLVGLSVCHNFLKGGMLHFQCFYRSTCFKLR